MLVIFIVKVVTSSRAVIGFCEGEQCNFTEGLVSLVVDPFADPPSSTIQESVSKHIKNATDVEIFFSVNEESNNQRFLFPLNIFLDKNLTMKKLDGQNLPSYIEFSLSKNDDYSSTGINIFNIPAKFKLIDFNQADNQLKFNEFDYFIEDTQKFQMFTENKNNLEIFGNKIGICDSIMFNFKIINLMDDSNNFIIQVNGNLESNFVDGKMKLINGTETVLVTYKVNQNVNFDSSNFNSKLILSIGNDDSKNNFPNINVSNIYNINIEGNWSDSDMKDVKNYLIIPRMPELDLNGIIRIKSEYVPFNMIGQSIELYFNNNYTKICGNIITSEQTIIYLEQKYKAQVLLEFVSHEIGKILIFHSNITLWIYHLQYFFENIYIFPVEIAVSNTEIAHVKIVNADFNNITKVVKYLSLINIMDRNPDTDMDFILAGSDFFLEMPFLSFYYFVGMNVSYNQYSNIIHGFENGVNCLRVQFGINYTEEVVYITTWGEPPMYIPFVLCIADDEKNCNKIGKYFYYIKDSTQLGKDEHVTPEFKIYDVYIFTENYTHIDLTDLQSDYYYFQFFLNGAEICIDLPNDRLIVFNLTLNDGTLVNDTKFVCGELYLSNIGCSEKIEITCDCSALIVDITSLPLIYHTEHVDQLVINDINDNSYILDITDDILFIDSKAIPWNITDSVKIYGYEFILNNNAIKIPGFDVIAVTDDTVFQFNGDYQELEIINGISVKADSYATIIYIYQPYLNPKITFYLTDKYQILISYMDIISYCVYIFEEESYPFCPDSYIKKSYLDLNSCADTNATHIEIYFFDKIPTSAVYPALDLNLFNSKELYLFSSNNFIRLIVTLPNDTIDIEYTSLTFQNFLVYVQYDYVGQQINTKFGYLTMIGSGFMNAKDVTVSVNHFAARFYNLRDWKNITIIKDCYLNSFNTAQPYVVNFEYQEKYKNRLNFYLENTDHDRLIIFGDKKIYYNSAVYNIPEDNDFEVNIFVTDYYHPIEFHCNESGKITNINIICTSYGPVYFTGLWYMNDGYKIDMTIDRDTMILIEYYIVLNIYGTGSPTIYGGTFDCGILGEIVLTQTDNEAPNVLAIGSVFPKIKSKMVISSLRYKFFEDFDDVFTAVVMFATNIILSIIELGCDGVPQKGYNFISYMDNNGVSQINLFRPIEGMKMSNEIIVYLNLTGNLYNEDDYKILSQNISILTAPTDNTYYDIGLFLLIDEKSLTHGFSQIVKMQKIDQYRPGYSNFYLYADKSPLEIPYVVQFAIDGNFNKNIDVGISQYQKIDTAFDSVPFKIHQIDFIVSSVIPINFPIIVSTIDSKYGNVTFCLTNTLNDSINTIYIDEPGAGISTLKIERIKLKKESDTCNLFKNVKYLWMNRSEIDSSSLNGVKDIKNINADIISFLGLIPKVTFSGETEAVIRGTKGIIFGEDFWYIRANSVERSINNPKIEAKQFKSMTVEASNDIYLQIFKEINQTVISGLNISFTHNSLVRSYNVKFDKKWKNILNMSCLCISSPTYINIITMSMPLNCHINAPSYKISFDPESKEQFSISDAEISESFEMDLTQFTPKQHIVIGDTVVIMNRVAITFKDDIGQIESKELIIMDDAQVSISNISVKNLIKISPGSTLEINELTTKNNTHIELHWNSSAFPLLSVNESVMSDNISLILDDKSIDINVMNALLFNTKRVIISGDFDCETWQWKINLIASSPYYRSGNSNVLSFQCKKVDEIWNLVLSSYKNVTIVESNAGPTENGSSLPLIIGFSAAAVVVVAIISISFYYLCRDARKVKLKEKRKQIRETMVNNEKKQLVQTQNITNKIASSSYDDLTSFTFSESSETEENDYNKRLI